MAQIDYTQALIRFDDYVSLHMDEEDLIEKAVKSALISKFHFYRLFKAVTGMTVNGYIVDRKLIQVIKDLMGNKNILDIALDNGFNSNEVLTRNFKKSIGITPAKFRKLNKDQQTKFYLDKSKAMKLDFRSLELNIVNKQGTINATDFTLTLENMYLLGKSRKSNDLMVDSIPNFVDEVVKNFTNEEQISEDAIYRICHSINEETIPPSFIEFVGLPIRKIDLIPDGYEVFKLEACHVLKFTHKGKLFSEDDIPVVNTYEMIYKYRLPALKILLTDDYYIERYGNDFLGINNSNSIITIMMTI